MTPEPIAIFGAGAALAAPIQHGQRAVGAEMGRFETAGGELRERMARLEGLFEKVTKTEQP